MPARDLKAITGAGGKPRWKKSDKGVQAEMKNKIEAARLRLCKKVYDRQQSHTKFTIEKERRQVSHTMRLMRETSGVSEHSLPPAGPADCEHEKSPYFQGGAAVNEKRFQRWRFAEKQFQRTLRNEQEDVMLPPWETDPYADIKEKFSDVAKRFGYEQDELHDLLHGKIHTQPAEKETLYTSKRLGRPTPQYKGDVFECLRPQCPVDNTPKIRKRDQNGTNGTDDNKFAVRKWEQNIVENYKNLSAKHCSVGRMKRPRRTKSASALLREYRRGSSVQSLYSQERQNSNGLTTSENGDSLESIPIDNGAEDGDCFEESLENMSLTDRKLRRPRPHTAGGRIGGATGTVTTVERRRLASLDGTEITLPGAVGATRDIKAPTDNTNTKPGQLRPAMKQPSLKTHNNLPSTASSQNGARNKKGQFSKPGNKVTFSDDVGNEAIEECPEEESVSDDGRRQSVTGFGGSDATSGEQARMNSRRDSNSSQMLQRQGSNSNTMFAPPPPADFDSGSELSDDEQSGRVSERQVFLGRRMRQWKKDLLIEAPPGLYTAKSPIKVSVVMSKAQRRRELDRLVDDNISDVKALVDQEHYRRLQSRVNVFLTVSTVQNAVSKVNGDKGGERQGQA